MRALSEDPFWNVADRERFEEQKIRSRIEVLSAAIEVKRKSMALRHATGFQDFEQAIRNLRSTAASSLERDVHLTNEGLREVRGRVRALDDILVLLRESDQDQRLAQELEAAQNALDEALRRRPKPREVT